jgi:hypothetical protein
MQRDLLPMLRRILNPSKWPRTLRQIMPLLGGIHYRAAFRFSVQKDHAVIRLNLTPDFIAWRSTTKSVEAAVDAELPSFWCVCRTTAGATENEASCHSTGERSNRWPFACGKAQSRRLVSAMPLLW